MRPSLTRNVLANVANVATGIAVALITTPVIIAHVGTSGYGVWTIATGFVLYLAIAEAGVGPATQRFIAVSHGRGDTRAAARTLWSTLALYLAVGLAAFAALELLAAPIARVFDFPRGLEHQAEVLLRLVGVALLVALPHIALGNALQGTERFVALAGTIAASSAAYLAAIVVLVASGASLGQLGYAVILQQVVILGTRLLALRHLLSVARPTFLSRGEWREIFSFSAKLQISVLSLLINGQSDKVVAGLVAPAATVGQLGIAVQVVEAGRLVAGSALAPLISRLSTVVGSGDRERLKRDFARLNRAWLLVAIGGTVIGMATLYPAIFGWLGDGYGKAVVFAEILALGSGATLLAGTRVAYLRATGQVSLEAWTGVLVVALNVAFTIPLALAFGAVGVVGGTLAASVLGTTWFFVRFRDLAPVAPPTPVSTLLGAAALATVLGGLALAFGVGMLAVLPAGVALAPIAIAALTAMLAYLSIVLGVRPTPRDVSAWLRSAQATMRA